MAQVSVILIQTTLAEVLLAQAPPIQELLRLATLVQALVTKALSILTPLIKVLLAPISLVHALLISALQIYISGFVNYLVNHEVVHKSMQPSYLYKNKDYKLYFTDCQYQKGGFKHQNLCYHRKKRMKKIEIDKARDKGNIMMS